jgi:hypothetical protein
MRPPAASQSAARRYVPQLRRRARPAVTAALSDAEDLDLAGAAAKFSSSFNARNDVVRRREVVRRG